MSPPYSQDEKTHQHLESDREFHPPFNGSHFPDRLPRHHHMPHGGHGPHYFGPVGFHGHGHGHGVPPHPPHPPGPHDPFHYEMNPQYNLRRSTARRIGVTSVALLAGFTVFSMGRTYEINRLEDALISSHASVGDVTFFGASGEFQHNRERGHHGMHHGGHHGGHRGEHHGQHQIEFDSQNRELETSRVENHKDNKMGGHSAPPPHSDCGFPQPPPPPPPPPHGGRKHRRKKEHGAKKHAPPSENGLQQERQEESTKGQPVQAADVIKELEGGVPNGLKSLA